MLGWTEGYCLLQQREQLMGKLVERLDFQSQQHASLELREAAVLDTVSQINVIRLGQPARVPHVRLLPEVHY